MTAALGGEQAFWRRDRILSSLSLDGTALVSLDIFDTLLLRTCGPANAVFPSIARMARAQGLLPLELTDDAFVHLRVRAEAEARAAAVAETGSAEVTLEGIYARLELAFPDATALAGVEMASEGNVLVVNPYLHSFLVTLKSRGIPVVLLSDMYLPEEALRTLLAGRGIDESLYQRLYVSCAHGVSKADGGLFRLLLADRPGTDPGRILHIGDNDQGDFGVPAGLGLRAVHYPVPSRFTAVADRERHLGLNIHSPLTPLRSLAARAIPADDSEDTFWHHFGCTVVGPVAVHFANWVVRTAAGLSHIAPLMREGALLAPLMAREAERLGLGLSIRPFHASRAALYLPTLTRFGEEELRTLCGGSVFRTVENVIEHLGFDRVPDELEASRGFPAVDTVGGQGTAGAAVYEALRRFVLAPSSVEAILERAAAARSAFVDYGCRELAGASSVGFVDIGARGTICARLDAIREFRERFDVRHYLFYAVPEFLDHLSKGLHGRAFMELTSEQFERARIIYRSPQFLEILLNGSARTTVGYARDGSGNGVPVSGAAPEISAEQHRAMAACRAGIWLYRTLYDRVAQQNPACSIDPEPADVLGVLFRAVHLPTLEEARRLSDLVYDINDGSSSSYALCNATARDAVVSLRDAVGPLSWHALALQTRPSIVPWPQGTMTLVDPMHLEDVQSASRSGFGHRPICRELIRRLRERNVERLVVCGAGGTGGMGVTFIEMARSAGLNVVGYVDLLVMLDENFHGAPALTFSKVATVACPDVAVVSVGYGARIVEALRAHAVGKPFSSRCQWFDGQEFRETMIEGLAGGAGVQ